MSQLPFILILASAAIAQSGNEPTAITIPLDAGKLTIVADFIGRDIFGDYLPELSFRMTNETSSAWRTIKLQFEIDGICNADIHHWSFSASVGIAHRASSPVVESYYDTIPYLFGKVEGCKAEIIKASLLTAENSKVRINRTTGERVDVEEERRKLNAQRDAEAARQKRLAAERDARIAKDRADVDSKAAEERRKIRAACAAIYKNTAGMKIKDLTVKDEQQVRACQALGLYPPQ
jgi:hypothetical protein